MQIILTAFQFLTIIPIPKQRHSDPELLAKSIVWFPLVGFSIGLILWGCQKILYLLFPQFITDLITVFILTIISGGIHVDGFVDGVEGFYAGRQKEEILRIMRDPCIGSIGAMALFFLLSFKIAFLYAIPSHLKGPVLLIVPMCGRWVMVFLASIGSYAGKDGGLGAAFISHTSYKQFFQASLITLIIIVVLFPRWGLLLLLLILALNYGIYLKIKGRIGGLTGDILGAMSEVTEVALLIMMLLFIRLRLI